MAVITDKAAAIAGSVQQLTEFSKLSRLMQVQFDKFTLEIEMSDAPDLLAVMVYATGVVDVAAESDPLRFVVGADDVITAQINAFKTLLGATGNDV